MALDRFVYFEKEVPTREQVTIILEDYLHGLGEIDRDDKDRVFVKIPGAYSSPFRRINERAARDQKVFGPGGDLEDPGRWFEVFFDLNDEGGKNIDVITRMADEVTNVIAEGFAKLIARYFQGRLEQG